MTSKLKCPFCQQELRKLFNRYTGEPNCDYECENCYGCDLYGIEMPDLVWQALIQAKQDLEIARKALKVYSSDSENWWYGYEFQGRYENYAGEYADKALEQIEHKE